jgi:sortase A
VPGPLSPPAGSTEAQTRLLPAALARIPAPLALPARHLILPTIGVDSKVVPIGTYIDRRGELAWETAAFAVGHHRGTAGPGQAGNMVLSGHISSPGEGAVFRNLPNLKVGEGIIVRTEERQYLYRVTDVQTVTPRDVSVMAQTPEPTVTLITCVPDGIYSHRLIVTGTLVS